MFVVGLAAVMLMAVVMFAFAYGAETSINISSEPGGKVYHVGDIAEYKVVADGPVVTPGIGEGAVLDATATVDVFVEIPAGGEVLLDDNRQMKPGYHYIYTSGGLQILDASDVEVSNSGSYPALSHLVQAGDLTEVTPGYFEIEVKTRYAADIKYRTVAQPGIERTLAGGDTGNSFNTVIIPSTEVTVQRSASLIREGDSVTWTIREYNDSPSTDATLAAPSIDVTFTADPDGKTGNYVKAPPEYVSGDTNGNDILDPGETWEWQITTNPTADQECVATGHGTDVLGLDVTYPWDPEERATAKVDVIHPTTITTIEADKDVVLSGQAVEWTITETNDSDDATLTSPSIDVTFTPDPDGKTDNYVKAPPEYVSGDTNGNGDLDPKEAWIWKITTNPTADQQAVATGHGFDELGNDVTYPADKEERATAKVDVINPTTITTISANKALVAAGDPVEWTITETNDSDDATLTSPSIDVTFTPDPDGKTDNYVKAPPEYVSGDTNGNGDLDPKEAWIWKITTNPTDDQQAVATGHGFDELGNDVTYPADKEERATAKVDVIHPTTITTIEPDKDVILSGQAVEWTITETNDSDDATLTSPSIDVTFTPDPDGKTDNYVKAPPEYISGDTNGNGDLDPKEAWIWKITTNPTDDQQAVATGHGFDELGNDVTYPADKEERATAKVDVIHPTTITTIEADASEVFSGDPVVWTITETNDSDDATLTSPSIDVTFTPDPDGKTGNYTKASLPEYISGDTNGNGDLDPKEAWIWKITTHPTADQQAVATGHGLDEFGNDITYPADKEERATASVTVKQKGITRTIGFWQTHSKYAYHVMTVHGGPFDLDSGVSWLMVNNVNEAEGFLWANPAWTEGAKNVRKNRGALSQAMIKVGRQLTGAILNTMIPDGGTTPYIGEAKTDMTAAYALYINPSATQQQIKDMVAELNMDNDNLTAFNESGDDIVIVDGDTGMSPAWGVGEGSTPYYAPDFTKPNHFWEK